MAIEILLPINFFNIMHDITCKQREITTISYFRISWYPVFSNIVKVDQVTVSDCSKDIRVGGNSSQFVEQNHIFDHSS
jgi:hypothetical protein